MHRLLGILLAAWALCPSDAAACGLTGPWYVRSDDGYTGIFVIDRVVDASTCEARLNVYSPLGDSAIEACRVLRSKNIVISCEVIATNFFWNPDNFILQGRGEVLKGQWVSGISANVVFAKQ